MKDKKILARVRNLNDLQRYKKRLHKKIFLRKKLLDKHLKDLENDLSAEYITKEVIKTLKLEGTFWQYIPNLFSNHGIKKLILPFLSGLGTALSSFMAFKKSGKKTDKETKTYSNTYREEDLFI